MKVLYLKKISPKVVVGTIVIGLCSWGKVIYELYDIFWGSIDNDFASTIITIHITVASFFIATLALLSSVVSKSYWGISVNSYILDLKQEFFKFRYIEAWEGILILCGIISYLFLWNSCLFGCCITSILGVAYLSHEIYNMLFKTSTQMSEEIADHLLELVKNKDSCNNYCIQFIKHWIKQVPTQSSYDFDRSFKLFIKLLFTVVNNEKDSKKVSNYAFNIANDFLGSDNVLVKERGCRLVVGIYEELYNISQENKEVICDFDLIACVQAKLQNALLYHLSSVVIQELFSRKAFIKIIKVSILCCKNNMDSNIRAINNLAKSLGDSWQRKEKIDPSWYKNMIKARRFDDFFSIEKNDEEQDNSGTEKPRCQDDNDALVDKQRQELLYKYIAEFDFNVCYGYLVNGLTDFVKDSVFPINDGTNDYSTHLLNRVFLVHCFMYYVALRENSNKYVSKSLSNSLNSLIHDKQVISFMNSFLWTLICKKESCLTKELYEEMKRVLNYKREFHQDGCEKVPIIETVVRDYYLFIVLYSHFGLGCNESLDTSINIKDFNFGENNRSFLVSQFKELYSVFEKIDKWNAYVQAKKLFDYYIREKPNLIIIKEREEALREQKKYEEQCKNDLQRKIKEGIKRRIDRYFYDNNKLLNKYTFNGNTKQIAILRDTKNIIDSAVFWDGIIDEANVQNVINKNIFAVVTNVQIQNPDISIFYMIKDKKTGLYMYSDDFWDRVGYEERDFADFISKKMKQIEITIRYE